MVVSEPAEHELSVSEPAENELSVSARYLSLPKMSKIENKRRENHMLYELYDFKKDLNNRGVFFCFSGPVSQDLLVEIGTILRKKMEFEETHNAIVLRVFSMVVEMAQNIIHYSAERCPREGYKDELSVGIIAVGYDNGHYFVLCGNRVFNNNVENIRNKLIHLQKMDKEQLKKHYKEQRKKGPSKGSMGAGLGFIDMAKKAAKPIEFDFKPVDEKFSFFSTKIVI